MDHSLVLSFFDEVKNGRSTTPGIEATLWRSGEQWCPVAPCPMLILDGEFISRAQESRKSSYPNKSCSKLPKRGSNKDLLPLISM